MRYPIHDTRAARVLGLRLRRSLRRQLRRSLGRSLRQQLRRSLRRRLRLRMRVVTAGARPEEEGVKPEEEDVGPATAAPRRSTRLRTGLIRVLVRLRRYQGTNLVMMGLLRV